MQRLCPGLISAFLAGIASFGSNAGASVCSEVRVSVSQSAVMERQAFFAEMAIENGMDTLSVEDLHVSLRISDADGHLVLVSDDPNGEGASFFAAVDVISGVNAVDGTGVIEPGVRASIRWLMVPAAGVILLPEGAEYLVGALIRYRVAGEYQEHFASPASITVHPLPLLSLDYFLPSEIHADDPLTVGIVEPRIPFTLGVRVRNYGVGVAKDSLVDSVRLTIVDNVQALPIDFRVVSSSVDDRHVESQALLRVGDVAPQSSRMARWTLETDFSGRFAEFQAVAIHAATFGGRLTSLVSGVQTHALVRDVRVDLRGRDEIRDFLALDEGTLRVYESDSIDTLVTDFSTVATLTQTGSNGSPGFRGRTNVSF